MYGSNINAEYQRDMGVLFYLCTSGLQHEIQCMYVCMQIEWNTESTECLFLANGYKKCCVLCLADSP